MSLKNKIIFLVLHFIRTKKNITKAPERILLVSTTGLGDSLWGTPALRALKKTYPEAYISILTSPIGASVFEKERCHVVKAPAIRSLIKLYKKLKKERYDTAYIFHTSQRPVLPFVSLLGPCRIIGTEDINKGFDQLLTHPFAKKYQHEINRRLELVGGGTDKSMEVPTSNVLPIGKNQIGMHIGANAPFKQWPDERFIEVGKWLSEKGYTVVLTGTHDEYDTMRSVQRAIPNAKLFFGTLSELAGMMSHFSIYITNDTGPMHVAIATTTPTIALFGPTDPNLCGPLESPHVCVIKAPPTCTPCLKQKCRAPFCMKQISAAKIIDTISKVLYSHQPKVIESSDIHLQK